MRGTSSARLESDAPSAAFADGTLVDKLDTGFLKRGDELHQGIDVAADHSVARLHALNGGKREPGRGGQVSLVHPHERSCRLELRRGDHGLTIATHVLYVIT